MFWLLLFVSEKFDTGQILVPIEEICFNFLFWFIKSYSKASLHCVKYESFSVYPILYSVGSFNLRICIFPLLSEIIFSFSFPSLFISLHSLFSSRMPVIQAELVKNDFGLRKQKILLTVFKQISGNFCEVNGQNLVAICVWQRNK